MRSRWARLAIADLDPAYDQVAADNPDAAERMLERIESATRVLARHPAAGRLGRAPATRELVITGTPSIVHIVTEAES